MVDIKYDEPIKVNILQYKDIMAKCRGMVAGRRDENGQYWIKVWISHCIPYIQKQLK